MVLSSICGGVFMSFKKLNFHRCIYDLSNARDEVFHAEVVNVFQPFNIFAKRFAIADGHNPGHASDIFYDFYCNTP